jgi:UDP:flavonoid glycosyltransferase YjiC (YdhE family)
VPSVIVPFAGDQFFWAARLRDAGIARHRLAAKSLTGPKLGEAIAFAERDAARDSVRRLGEGMRGEDGTSTAAALIERIAHRIG